MDDVAKLLKSLRALDIQNPQALACQCLDTQVGEIEQIFNDLICRYQKQKADIAILSENFTQTQSNLLESQKMAKVGSFEYNISSKEFHATMQVYRILGIKTTNQLTWTDLLDFLTRAQQVQLEQKIQTAINRGSRFSHRFSFLSISGKDVDVECRFKVRKRSSGDVKLIGTIMDITKQLETERTVEFLAFHDPLTGLGNRRLLDSRLEEAVAAAKRYENLVGVLFIDIDRFKYINDTLGHDVGDALIKKIAQILKSIVRESDTIIRLGGDEFIILLPRMQSVEAAKTVAKKILQHMKKPFYISTHKLFSTMSIGIATYPDHTQSAQELLTYADAAMYRAKELGRNNFQVYELNMTKDFSDQLLLEQDLRSALHHEDEIVLYYQPKVNLKSGKIVGAEALVRWNHPTLGLLYPDKFIDLAENTGMIIPIGQKVLELAVREIKQWEKRGLSVAVNLSGRQFQHGSLVQEVQQMIEKYAIDAGKLELEITETISMSNVKDSIRILKDLKKLGVTLSIDDFGTGYSSLSYLKKLPVDVLKIDREFIMDLHKDNGDVMISKAIIGMGKSLDYKIVAEGIEMQEHTNILNSMDCEFGQGYFYSKAVTKEEFEKLLQLES
ncbi:MAG: putative bifunctional diguanylate cyclase/phosphodiesterase [Campylobacterota bacterium]